jgi:hypothetical protein
MAEVSRLTIGGETRDIKDVEARRLLSAAVNRLYNGVDLVVKFAGEIAGYPSVWDWIKARIQAVNFSGIYVGDYIPFVCTNGYAIKAEIAGIDTYYNYGDMPVGHHIDFISRDCWPDAVQWNLANYNNGISTQNVPFLASNVNAYLNSLQANVPNGTGADPATVAVDYRTTGVYDKLPLALQNAIVVKHFLHPRRYTAGTLLTDDNGYAWSNYGKLWIPTEWEVSGATHWATQGYGTFGSYHYPIFATNQKHIKGAGDGGARVYWWLASPRSGNSASAGIVYTGGDVYHYVATFATFRAPLCFRIA